MKNRTLQTCLMKNWKTTLSGFGTAIATYWVVDYALGEAPLKAKIAQWLVTMGLVTSGAVAKDADSDKQ